MTIVAPDDDGQRLDRWLKKNYPDLGFGQLQKLLRTGQVRIDGKRAKPDTRLTQGQDIRLPPQLANTEVAVKTSDNRDKTFIKSLVIYEDEDLVVINKPAGIAVQGGSGITRHIDGMLDGLTGANGVRPRLVHRLDRETSGTLLLARSAEVARRLMTTFSGRDIEKVYLAITEGVPTPAKGRIDAPLAKGMAGENLEKVLRDDDIGKSAITDYAVVAKAADHAHALVEFHPLTGRTHQIRVHASLIGHPLWGDRKYDAQNGTKGGGRFYLHARSLTLDHPKTGRHTVFEAPLSADFKAKCKTLGIPVS